MEKILIIFLAAITLQVVLTRHHEHCDKFYHTGTPKTLVKFYDSSNNAGSFEELQNGIWEQLKEHFSDYADISFVEVDCYYCQSYCYNFFNESLPSYTMVYDDLLMSTCVRPITFEKARNYVYDYSPRKYKKKKNFSIAITHCNIVYPDLNGTEINNSTFDEAIKEGLSNVLFATRKCHYCRMFTPLWGRLISLFEGQQINFYFIDCIAQKEFCESKNVTRHPTLNLYGDGKLIEEYYGTENITQLKAFTDHHMRNYEEKGPDQVVQLFFQR